MRGVDLIVSRFMNALTSPLLASLLVGFASVSAGADAGADSSESPDAAANLEKQAEALEGAGVFASAAEVWVKLLAETDELDTRTAAAYRAQNAYRTAASSDHTPESLCRALEIIDSILHEPELAARDRKGFETVLRQTEAELIVDFNETCPLKQHDSKLLPIGHHHELGPPSPAGNDPATPQLTRKQGIAVFAGSALVTAGVGLLALGTYGLVEDYRAAQELRSMLSKDAAVGLTEAEITHYESVRDQGWAGSDLAIRAGISGGIALISGAVVLGIVDRKTRGKRLDRAAQSTRRLSRIQPHLDLSPQGAGFSLRTQF